jgi:hypothetical protein
MHPCAQSISRDYSVRPARKDTTCRPFLVMEPAGIEPATSCLQRVGSHPRWPSDHDFGRVHGCRSPAADSLRTHARALRLPSGFHSTYSVGDCPVCRLISGSLEAYDLVLTPSAALTTPLLLGTAATESNVRSGCHATLCKKDKVSRRTPHERECARSLGH